MRFVTHKDVPDFSSLMVSCLGAGFGPRSRAHFRAGRGAAPPINQENALCMYLALWFYTTSSFHYNRNFHYHGIFYEHNHAWP